MLFRSQTAVPGDLFSGALSPELGWTSGTHLTGEGSPAPQFENMNSSALNFLYVPTLTSVHDCWKKTIALTIWIFVGKVTSLLFNTLSKLVIAFLPRSECLLISWLQSPSAVILEPKKMKSIAVSIFPHLFAGKGWDRMP